VIPAVTVKVTPEFAVKVAVPAVLLLNMIEFAVAFAVTVTEAPARITALSVLAGTTPPDQELVAFQLPPDAVVILVAPWLTDTPMNINSAVKIKGKNCFIVLKLTQRRDTVFKIDTQRDTNASSWGINNMPIKGPFVILQSLKLSSR
jgi:hypothetical protein